MYSFRPDYLSRLNLPGSTAWLVGACMEAKGKQELWLRQKPEVLEALKELAIIQSVESSNRIEGVTVAPDRLRPVVLGEVEPRERPETGPFSLADIRSQCPSVSAQSIKKVLKKLKEERKVRLSGKGRGARWYLEE